MTDLEKQLREILPQRLVILDGAMGTMIQAHKLDEKAFRGDEVRRSFPRPQGM